MGKQINYYMDYESFVCIAKKAIELGCEIIRGDHVDTIIRGYSINLISPDCKWYYFHLPEAGEVTFGKDMNGKSYVNFNYSESGNSMIEADYSFVCAERKEITRSRLFCFTGYYGENGEFINRPECVTKVYNSLVRYAKKIAPFTEITEKLINSENELYEYKHKVYITKYCLKLFNEGYSLRNNF